MRAILALFLASVTPIFLTATPHEQSGTRELQRADSARIHIAESAAQATPADSTAKLVYLAAEAGHAYADRDLPVLESLTAEDYVQTDTRGGVLNRSQWLSFVKNRKSDLTVDTDDVHVTFYGSTAVVTGHWMYTVKRDGKDVITNSRWTSVWTHEGEGWKRHAFQNTYVNPNADLCAIEAAQK